MSAAEFTKYRDPRGWRPGEMPDTVRSKISATLRDGYRSGRLSPLANLEKAKIALLPNDRQRRIVEMYVDEKRSSTEIADHFGVSCVTILKWLRRFGVEIRKAHDPVVIEQVQKGRHGRAWSVTAKAKAARCRRQSHLQNARSIIEVPAWVPASLHETYRNLALYSSEEDAASWARAEKRRLGQ